MASVVSVFTWPGHVGNSDPVRRDAGRFVLVSAPLCVALLAAALTVATALGLPSQAFAADAPQGLDSMVTDIARTEAKGPVVWARYVATTADVAADLLGKSRDELFEGTPDRVYVVVMHGDFSMR